MRKAHAYVLLAVAVVALWLLWRADDARGPESDLSGQERAGRKAASLTAEAVLAPGLNSLSEEQRARLKQKPAARPPVLVRVTWRGQPVVGRMVRLFGTRLDELDSLTHEGPTDERGEFRYALPKGIYTIGLVPPPPPPVDPVRASMVERLPERIPNLMAQSAFSMDYAQKLLTHRGPLPEPLRIKVPPGVIHARVRTPTGRPIEGARVGVRRKVVRTDARGEARLVELQAGGCSLHVSKQGYTLVDPLLPQRVLKVGAKGDTHVDVVLARAGTLQLRFVDREGVEIWAPSGTRPVAVSDARNARPVPGRIWPLGMYRRLGPDADPLPATFGAVLPGRYRISLEDERIEQGGRVALRTQPFDPVQPVTVEVVAGSVTTAEFVVRLRAHVSLGVFDAGGKAQYRGVGIRVFSRSTGAERRVQWVGGDSHDPWRADPLFGAHLPPGTYDVEITRDGAVEQHELVVGRERVGVGYKPR